MAGSIPPLERKYVKGKIANLNAGLMMAETETLKHEEVQQHIRAVEKDPQFQLDPEFPSGLDWFNSSPLSFSEQLRGKLVVLDFFTYCCINCMHILPDLEHLEERHPVASGGVVVVGVHSAKFGNEKVSENIQRAIERYDCHCQENGMFPIRAQLSHYLTCPTTNLLLQHIILHHYVC